MSGRREGGDGLSETEEAAAGEGGGEEEALSALQLHYPAVQLHQHFRRRTEDVSTLNNSILSRILIIVHEKTFEIPLSDW